MPLTLSDSLAKSIEDFTTNSFTNNIELSTHSFVNPLFEHCLEEFKKLDADFSFRNLLRILLARLPVGHSHADGIHRDYDSLNHWSFLIHLKGTSGNTCFYESIIKDKICKSIPFKPYTLIIFPSLYAHKGMNTTTIDRYHINFIMELDTKLNGKILDKSSANIFK